MLSLSLSLGNRVVTVVGVSADVSLHRLLHQEWQDGNIEHLKFQARMLTNNAPKCLANWKM